MRLIVNALLLALSLCADCFAVALCSGFTVGREELRKKVWTVVAVFSFIHTGFLLSGWGAGILGVDLISSHVAHFEKVAHFISFLLLLYVGGEMFLDGVRSKSDHLNLDGIRGILMGAVATSIDAAAVGLSMALDAVPWQDMSLISLFLFVFTGITVAVGMLSGSFIGRKLGYSARIVGGLVLIGLGIRILL